MTDRHEPDISVFNCHINNAKDRALKVMKADLPPKWHAEITKADEHGIMCIFAEPPTPAVAAFVALVTLFVNGEPE